MSEKSEKLWAIVDDDTIFQYSIRRLINQMDSQVKIIPYFDGTEFLEFLKSHSVGEFLPTEVLMDINMPLMDAWGFLDELEQMQLHEEMPFRIHLMTSSISSRDRKLYEEKDYLGYYLIKPISEDQILKIVNNGFKPEKNGSH